MADMQVKFDCFIDNEILNNNPKQAKVCYKKFAKTMAILNKKLEEICDGKCKLARQEKNIGKNLLRKKDLKSNLQVARKKSKLKHTKRNPQLNRYVEIYPLNEIDKLMEEKILIKNEAFVRPIGKKVPNNEFVIPIKDNKKTTEEKKIPSGFANTVAGTDLANKAAVSVKPVSEQDKAKDETQIDTKPNVTDNIPSMASDGKASLYDIQKKLQEIELKIDLLSKKNCNCNLDAVKKDLSNLTDKTNEIKETGDNDAVASLEKETKNLEDQIDSIEPDKDETTEDEIESDVTEDSASVASESADKVTENGGSITVESEITEEIEVIEEDEKADDLIDATKDPEFQQITEKETVETEIFDKPSSALPYELYFDWDKDNVKPEYRTQLQDITDKALKSKETIVIQGHTDNTGNEKYNDDLSKRRATNVGKVVMSYGVPKEKIILQGVGSREPKVPTKKGQRNEKNRRVVIK